MKDLLPMRVTILLVSLLASTRKKAKLKCDLDNLAPTAKLKTADSTLYKDQSANPFDPI